MTHFFILLEYQVSQYLLSLVFAYFSSSLPWVPANKKSESVRNKEAKQIKKYFFQIWHIFRGRKVKKCPISYFVIILLSYFWIWKCLDIFITTEYFCWLFFVVVLLSYFTPHEEFAAAVFLGEATNRKTVWEQECQTII